MNLDISNVVNVSIATPQQGVGEYNTSNLAIFTEEPFDSETFGADGYKIYLSPTEVGVDFGTDSKTYAMANAIYSQQPNIGAGGGYLVVIPTIREVQKIAFSGTPNTGALSLEFEGELAAAIAFGDSAAAVQAKMRAVPGLESVVVTGSITTTGLTFTMAGLYGPQPLIVITANTLANGGGAVTPTVSQITDGETIAAAITRSSSLIQYFGGMGTVIFDEDEMLAAAAVIQAMNKLFFFVSRTAADVDTDGMLDLLAQGSFTKSRGLFYGGTTDQALGFMASYAGLALSVNFNGSNTTMTMDLKTLIGVLPDPTISQTILNQCKTSGVDTYPSLEGIPKVVSSEGNVFFDRIYNQQWIAGAFRVALFNVLAQTSTKIPQTENGMDVLKGAARKVCEQGVANQYLAPGDWNSTVTFGNQTDLVLNVAQRGYYIYSSPISKQLPSVREARNAPVMQIALKEAGAMHKATLIVNINA